MALAEAVGGEALELAEDLLGDGKLDAIGLRAGQEAVAQDSHRLGRAAAAHRPAQQIGLARREARQRHGDADHLLLEDDHAQRFAQDRLQAGVQVGHRLEALAPAQVGMHHAALDRAGPHDGDLDDEIGEALRLEPRQHRSLGAALDLEAAEGVAVDQQPVDGRIVQRQRVQIGLDPVALRDQRAHLGHHAQGGEAQQVGLDQAGILDRVFVPLRHHDARLGGVLQRHDLDQRLGGDQHAAGVDGEVARDADELGGQVGQQCQVAGSGAG